MEPRSAGLGMEVTCFMKWNYQMKNAAHDRGVLNGKVRFSERTVDNKLPIADKKCRPQKRAAFSESCELVACAGLRRLRRLAVFNPAFIAKLPALGRLLLAVRRLAVLVHFFLHKAGRFLGLTLDAHIALQWQKFLIGNSQRRFLFPSRRKPDRT